MKKGTRQFIGLIKDAKRTIKSSKTTHAPKENKKAEAYIYPMYENPTVTSQSITQQNPYQGAPLYIQQTQMQPKYKRKNLLTQNEYNFYIELKRVADILNLSVLAKIRVADLVEPTANENSEYYKEFAKIKAKHVDFALCDPNTLCVLLLIELDDSTHDTRKGRDRDNFVQEVYRTTGYGLYRARNAMNLEQNIKAIISTIKW